ncbi:phosphatase PAP2 family protein [Salinirubrum litoreum]|uniref:Phosphatase PAP2 family protein n=1 Tax=Salinirubrum litoreum TaxID=1126234 RepID=A0ABD5RE93_9EURY|nr:phosphatase PAP2 family protein [Salinirubrum litoreum]
MSRAVGVTDLLASAPDWVVAVFALVTQLGDAWFLFGAFSLLYWLGPSRDLLDRPVGATLIGLGLAAVGLTVAAKFLFALPRPPGAGTAAVPPWLPAALGDLYVSAATGDGFGFPSGHALGSTVAYGGLALLADAWDRRRRLLAAGLVAVLVSLSRLVLGVHYLADVLAGMALGVVVLWTALRLTERGRRPGRLFAGAVVVAVVGVGFSLLHAERVEAMAVLGATVGGLLGWRYADGDLVGDRRVVPLPAAGVGLLVAGGLFAGSLAVEPPLPVVFAVNVASVGLVLALPAVAGE